MNGKGLKGTKVHSFIHSFIHSLYCTDNSPETRPRKKQQ